MGNEQVQVIEKRKIDLGFRFAIATENHLSLNHSQKMELVDALPALLKQDIAAGIKLINKMMGPTETETERAKNANNPIRKMVLDLFVDIKGEEEIKEIDRLLSTILQNIKDHKDVRKKAISVIKEIILNTDDAERYEKLFNILIEAKIVKTDAVDEQKVISEEISEEASAALNEIVSANTEELARLASDSRKEM